MSHLDFRFNPVGECKLCTIVLLCRGDAELRAAIQRLVDAGEVASVCDRHYTELSALPGVIDTGRYS